MSHLLSYIVAFTITFGLIVLLKPLAIKIGLVDKPGGRKFHQGNIPLLGGISMFIGISFALLTLDISLSAYRCLIACTALLVVTGLLDDFQELTPRSRLGIQIFTGCLIVWCGNNTLLSFGDLFSLGNINLGYLALPITVFSVVTVINAVNMTDGNDGLAASVSFIEFFYLGWLSYHAGLINDKHIIDLILSALLAFLYFNFPFKSKANIFMGDGGSMMLGFLLAWFCIYLSQVPHQAAHPVILLWIMAIPLLDLVSVVLQRVLRGFSPFKADRRHLHHCLAEKNFSSLQITIIISTLSGILGLIGIIANYHQFPDSLMLISFLILFSTYFFISTKYLV